MPLESVWLSFEGEVVEGFRSQEFPERLEVEGVSYVVALEIIYREGQSSINHYQVKRLLRARMALGIPVLVLTDNESEDHREIVVLYLGAKA